MKEATYKKARKWKREIRLKEVSLNEKVVLFCERMKIPDVERWKEQQLRDEISLTIYLAAAFELRMNWRRKQRRERKKKKIKSLWELWCEKYALW
jgi:hypothetical protein